MTSIPRTPARTEGLRSPAVAPPLERLTTLFTRQLRRLDPHELEALGALTDDQLLLTMVGRHAALSAAMDPQELERQLSRLRARQAFFAELRRFGGVVKAGEAAALMNATRQTVNNHIKAGRLIGIKEGNDHLIPAFQFIKGGKVGHLEDLLARLDCAPITQCGFFMAQTETGEARIEVLRRGPSPEELRRFTVDATLLLKQMP